MGLDVIALLFLAVWAGAEIEHWRHPVDSTESLEAGHTKAAIESAGELDAGGHRAAATPRPDNSGAD